MSTPILTTAYRFTIRAEVAPFRVIGQVDGAELAFIEITGGVVSGGLTGVVLPGGGDWATFHDDDTVAVDARYQMQLDDGTVIDIHNTGTAHWVDPERTSVGYFATHPRFLAHDGVLADLRRRVHVGWARSTPAATEIDIFEVVGPDELAR